MSRIGRETKVAEEKLYRYELSCDGGLEDILIDELRQCLGKRVSGLREERGEVGRVFFDYEGSPRHLLALECAGGVSSIVLEMHDITVGDPGLEKIRHRLAKLPLISMGRMARIAAEEIDVEGYRLRVRQRGAHRFSVTDTEAAVRKALAESGLSPSENGFDLELRLQKRRAQLKLSLRHRGRSGPVESEGLGSASIAAIIRMLDLDESDDTVLIQGRSDAALAAKRVCQGRVVCTSMRRPVRPTQHVIVSHPDHLPLGAGTMTTAIVVIGDQEMAQTGVSRLTQAVNCVAEDGVIAALVPRAEGFAARLPEWGLPVEVMGAIPVFVRRRRWALFLLHRLALVHLG